jgi:hypothetical protein
VAVTERLGFGVHSAGGKAVRAAERLGLFRKTAAFFRRSPRLFRKYMADDGAAGGVKLDRTMTNVRGVIDRYGIRMNPGARIRIDLSLRGVRGDTLPNRMIRLGPRAFENDQAERVAYAAFWCDNCLHGIHVSRAGVPAGARIHPFSGDQQGLSFPDYTVIVPPSDADEPGEVLEF